MPSDTMEPGWSPDRIAEVRAQAKAVIAAEFENTAAAHRESGIAYATFSAFLNASYNGRMDRVAADVEKWLRTRAEKKAIALVAPEPPRYVETPTAEDIMATLRHAQHMPDFVVISLPPGSGKTTVACRYTREVRNVFKITGHPTLISPIALLDEFCRALGITERTRRQQRAIVAKLRGTNALLIVDEAGHLTSPALDQLRSIHDEADVGIAVLGNSTVIGRIEGGARSAQFAQLHSRVGMRLKRSRLKDGDVNALVAAWGIEGEAERKLLRLIGSKPGGLRNVTKALKLGHMVAAADGKPLAAGHIKSAWAQLGDDLAQGDAA